MALYTEAELAKKSIADLKALAKENNVDLQAGWKKKDLIDALAELEEPDIEEELDEDEDDIEDTGDEEVDDEEEDELDEPELDDEEEDDIEEAPAKKSATKKAVAKKDVDPDALAAKQVATLLGTEAKTLRQFLRSDASTFEAVGSGGRYEFTEADVPKIKTEFEAWKSAHASRGTKRTKDSTPDVVDEVEEVEEIEELEELDDEVDDDDLELDD